jgi:hypothetical protein
MSKAWTPKKKTVELKPAARPSKIRRDPALADTRENLGRDAWWESREWEIRLAIIGIIFFALAINALVLDISWFTK